MKVLLINYEFPPVGGGAGNATYELSRALVQLGHEPLVLTARYAGRTPAHTPPGVRLIEVPARRTRADRASLREMASFTVRALLAIRGLLRRERPDQMWAFFSMPCGPIAWWGWRATKIPYLVLLRGGDVPGNEPSLRHLHTLLRPLRHVVMRHARAIVANSEALKTAAEKADPFPVSVVPNGVDTTFWHPPAEPRPALPRRYLFVGRFQPQKNLPGIFDLMAQRLQAGETFELHLVGDGPQRAELETLATHLRLADRITWHGWLPKEQLRTQYQRCHVMLNLSHYEGMSNAVLEAQACGMEVGGEGSERELIPLHAEWKGVARTLVDSGG
ncbi:glycosyltransferase family 4 protein [Nibricoccus sp. IMCC34717]|uniref:glycosyltransferase family 4 protein n=1 Tax=Nibricoccus sp. IMCC34717 TaxID=3034021 RepID=UPI0038505E68